MELTELWSLNCYAFSFFGMIVQLREGSRVGREAGERVVPVGGAEDRSLAGGRAVAGGAPRRPARGRRCALQWLHLQPPLRHQDRRHHLRQGRFPPHRCRPPRRRKLQQPQGPPPRHRREDHLRTKG